jgi:hypothetical protein
VCGLGVVLNKGTCVVGGVAIIVGVKEVFFLFLCVC